MTKEILILFTLLVLLLVTEEAKAQSVVVLSLPDPCQALQAKPLEKTPERSLDFSIYPNPAREQITLSLNKAGIIGLFSLRITDITGVVVKQEQFYSENQQWLKVHNISDLASGTYVVSIIQGNEVVSKMIIKR